MIEDVDIFFHEDDYSLIEIIPTPQKIEVGAEEDFFSIYSYNDICFKEYELNVVFFEKALENGALKNIRKVFTGYSSKRIAVNNCCCFCYENYALFYKYKNEKIDKVWLSYVHFAKELRIYPLKLQEALITLGNTFNLMMVDWNELLTVDLNIEEEVSKYVKEML